MPLPGESESGPKHDCGDSCHRPLRGL